MSPRSFTAPPHQSVLSSLRRAWVTSGMQIRDARVARRWTVHELAARAGVSRAVAYDAEAGNPTSVEAIIRLATALGLRLEWNLVDPRKRGDGQLRPADTVHSAMGEVEAARLRRSGVHTGIDEPYQHYQFAGRADVAAWDLDACALLHIENRTRFPNLQEVAGSFNAKRAYLGIHLAGRLGVRRWSSETHVIVALWSAEVLHSLRLRPESFHALCPDPPDAFGAWWSGSTPEAGVTSSLIVLDPLATGRQRRFIGLPEAMSARPRHRGYADVASKLLATGPWPR